MKKIQTALNTMTLRQKIGQRLIAGFPSTTLSDDFIRMVKEYKVGNAVLFAHNIESKEQIIKLCNDIQELVIAETGFPAFISIDQEGGVVTRLAGITTHVPGAMALAATGKPEYAYRSGRIIGKELRALGINFDLAPDLDVNSNPQNPVIGTRSYGDTPETVIRYGVEMIRGLSDEGIVATAKHFPGHGDTLVDSHLGLPEVNRSLEELNKVELKPFRAAVSAGVPAIMTSHILYPALEPEKVPATMSRAIITGLLKEEMGFRGLVISDCMEMNAIKEYYGVVDGTVVAMKAGVDMVFISHTTHLNAEASIKIEAAVRAGEIREKELDDSVARILEHKERYAQFHGSRPDWVHCFEHVTEAYRMIAETISVVNLPASGQPALGRNPLFIGCRPYRFTQISNNVDKTISFADYMADELGGEGINTSVDPEQAEIDELLYRASSHSTLVIATYNGHLNKGQLAMVNQLSQLNIPMIVIALRNPYDLKYIPQHVFSIAAYEYTYQSLKALAEILSGKCNALGRLCVSL